MRSIYKSPEGERAVRERYLYYLEHWPVPNQQLRIPTCEGETFVVASGADNAPPLLLLHGAQGNAAMWLADIAVWAAHFRVYAVDVIGDAGLSAPSRPKYESEAHALWLDDVMQGLALERAAFLGVSNGGWLTLDYATRRPERVTRLVVLCPGGVGPHRNILWKALPFLLLGGWGARKVRKMVLGGIPVNAPDRVREFAQFVALIFQHMRPRTKVHPRFTDEALRQLTMPVMAILGGKDVIIDSAAVRQRLERTVPQAEIRFIPEAGHFIPGQAGVVRDFLTRY
jgi:pimeloyl-ACP methyl ester carboxylesterase